MTEYISAHLWIIWGCITILCILAELSTGGFYILCLAFGALVTLPFSLIIDNWLILILIFSIVSFLAIFFVRPALVKLESQKNGGSRKSNISALIGEKGVVTENIEKDGYGRVKAGGDDWKAQSENGEPLTIGTKVVVVKQESLIITVKTI